MKRGASIPSLHSFFRDETARMMKDNADHSKDLTERDTAMVENTSRHLSAQPQKKIVLLVVGYAHVAGLQEKLKGRRLSFLGCKLSASDDRIEQCEEDACALRKCAGEFVFAKSEKPNQLKELSLLLKEGWKTEQIAKLEFFRAFDIPNGALQPSIRGLAWEGCAFEISGGEPRAMRVRKFPFDPNAQFSAQTLDRGSIPGKPGEF